MVRPTYKPHWDIPGGHIEAGEHPLDACVREVQEEIGLIVAIRSMLVIDWLVETEDGDKAIFIFDGGRLTDEQLANIRFLDGELDAWAFTAPGDLEEVTIPRMARRLRQALAARAEGRARYLQDGRPAD